MDEGISAKEIDMKNEKEVNGVEKKLVEGNDGESNRGKDVEKEASVDMVPKEGMEFNSLKDVQDFYNNYAEAIGFRTKIRGTWKTGEMVTKCVLSCVREGKCDRSKKNKFIRHRTTTRCGCNAQIAARLFEDGLWCLTKVKLEHNHLVSPSKIRFFRNNRSLTRHVKRKLLEPNEQLEIPIPESFVIPATYAGSTDNLSLEENVARDCVESARSLKLEEADARAMRLYFKHQREQNRKFFHSMDFDDEGYLRHVFWADARSRALYQSFGDAISFDTASLTKKDGIPFVSFVGVNNHGCLVLLGCGILSDETIDSYEWLFTSWLTCMHERPPNAIITVHCPSIQAAISKVFPTTKHRLFLWHIMKEIHEKLDMYKEREEIVSKIKNIVYDSMKAEVFEQCWGEMIERFSLRENAWLQSLFDIRHKWVPVFIKYTFWAGIATTECSENLNSLFDGCINLKTSLKQFFSQYAVALDRKYENESFTDFNSFHKERELVSTLPYEKELRKFYTNNMFAKFQDEVKNMVNCRVKCLEVNGSTSKYEVRDRRIHDGALEPIVKNFEVWFHADKMQVQCICGSFEFRGILCSHAISVLDYNDVPQLPSQYVVQRWRKDFKKPFAQEHSSLELGGLACAPLEWYCRKIAEIGSESEWHYKKALTGIKKLEEQLLACDNDNDGNF